MGLHIRYNTFLHSAGDAAGNVSVRTAFSCRAGMRRRYAVVNLQSKTGRVCVVTGDQWVGVPYRPVSILHAFRPDVWNIQQIKLVSTNILPHILVQSTALTGFGVSTPVRGVVPALMRVLYHSEGWRAIEQ